MPSDDTVELVIKLHDAIKPGSSDYESLRSTLSTLGIALDNHAMVEAESPLTPYRSFIVPRGVASRAVDALKGNAAVDGAFVKPRGETP
jgi:hypothetical protein